MVLVELLCAACVDAFSSDDLTAAGLQGGLSVFWTVLVAQAQVSISVAASPVVSSTHLMSTSPH